MRSEACCSVLALVLGKILYGTSPCYHTSATGLCTRFILATPQGCCYKNPGPQAPAGLHGSNAAIAVMLWHATSPGTTLSRHTLLLHAEN